MTFSIKLAIPLGHVERRKVTNIMIQGNIIGYNYVVQYNDGVELKVTLCLLCYGKQDRVGLNIDTR